MHMPVTSHLSRGGHAPTEPRPRHSRAGHQAAHAVGGASRMFSHPASIVLTQPQGEGLARPGHSRGPVQPGPRPRPVLWAGLKQL